MPGSRTRAFWAGYRSRSENGRTRGDVAYLVYVTVLTALVVAAPLLRALVLTLREEPLAARLVTPDAAAVVGLVLGVVTVLTHVLGGVHGPTVLRPFLMQALAGNDLPRRRTLRRPTVRAGLVLTGVLVLVNAVLVGSLADRTLGPLTTVAVGVGAALAYGVVLVTVWLWGQVWRSGRSWVAAPVGLALLAVSVAVPVVGGALPWGWFAATWPVDPTLRPGDRLLLDPLTGLGALVVLTALCLILLPRLLDRLRGAVLAEQAARWDRAGGSLAVGDLTAAAAQFRAGPGVGRSWRVVHGGSFVVAAVVADLRSPWRAPGRAGAGLLGLALGGWLLGEAGHVDSRVAAGVLAGAAALAVHAGLGAFTDGLRHAAANVASPGRYGGTDARLVVAGGIGPVLVGLLGLAVGLGAAALGSSDVGAVVTALGWGAALVPALVVLRVFDAAKGQLPPELMTPVVTPVGDGSALLVLLWQLDAVLLATGLGALTGLGLVDAEPWRWAAWLAGLAALVLWRARARLRR